LAHPNVVIIDDKLARSIWPRETAVGKRLQVAVFLVGRTRPTWAEVVGVVEHLRHHPGRTTEGAIFLPHRQSPQRTMTLAIRSRRTATALAAEIGRIVRTLESSQPIHAVRPMDDYRRGALAAQRFTMLMLGLFAGVAVALASVGIYGVVAFAVTERRHEIGLRMALGATPGRVLRTVVGQELLWTTTGLGLGLAAAFALTPLLSNLLVGVRALDPWTYSTVTACLALVAVAACFLPARRAASIEPSEALREE
jgi:hypothetical protein